MAKKSKFKLVLIEIDKDGEERHHNIKLKSSLQDNEIDTVKWWIKRAISSQEYEDDQPAAGMASGCW